MKSLSSTIFSAVLTSCLVPLLACSPSPRGEDPGDIIDAAIVDAFAFPDSGPVIDARPSGGTGPVAVTITADNAYSFGYGNVDGIATFFQGTRAQTAGQIFNCPIGEGPEEYTVPAEAVPNGAYLYIVSWDDLAVTRGVIGQFIREGATVYTGDTRFEVCATGIDFSQSQVGPTQQEVNAQIAICNAGSGDPSLTSKGWVNGTSAVTSGATGTLAIGQDNSVSYNPDFPITCQDDSVVGGAGGGIDPQAHWMWYQPGGLENPFQAGGGGNSTKAYLIFRLAAEDIIPIP